jgi:hypothetical protein
MNQSSSPLTINLVNTGFFDIYNKVGDPVNTISAVKFTTTILIACNTAGGNWMQIA